MVNTCYILLKPFHFALLKNTSKNFQPVHVVFKDHPKTVAEERGLALLLLLKSDRHDAGQDNVSNYKYMGKEGFLIMK